VPPTPTPGYLCRDTYLTGLYRKKYRISRGDIYLEEKPDIKGLGKVHVQDLYDD
jgi:hypothetical protein